jgi:hypothetical protein
LGVRYTFNCVLWFNNFEHLLSADIVAKVSVALQIRNFRIQRLLPLNQSCAAASCHEQMLRPRGTKFFLQQYRPFSEMVGLPFGLARTTAFGPD